MRLFVEQLTVIDFSYLHADRGLLGESWRVDLELEGVLDDQGMLLDFGAIKRQFKQAIDESFDHKLLVPGKSEKLTVQTIDGGNKIHFGFGEHDFVEHAGPDSALTIIDAEEINQHTVKKALTEHLQSILPANISGLKLSLLPESDEQVYYQYSHGLKYHNGNCQRIAHGHRSRIQIFKDGERDSALESDWALQWQDIYIGTREDLIGNESHNGQNYLRFAYDAMQGNFELLLPERCCHIINTESTVENIAQYITNQIATSHPHSKITVRAFEGIGKGAIGSTVTG